MSSQFSATPLPAGDEWHCPQCDAKVSETDERCWLCGEKFADTRLSATPKLPVPPQVSEGHGSTVAAFIILAIVVAGGLAMDAPGLLIVLGIALVPALIRTSMISSRRPAATQSTGGIIASLLTSLGVVLGVGIATFAAFFATCFAVCLGGMALSDMSHGGRGMGYQWVLFPSVGGGLAVGVTVLVWLVRRLWLPKR